MPDHVKLVWIPSWASQKYMKIPFATLEMAWNGKLLSLFEVVSFPSISKSVETSDSASISGPGFLWPSLLRGVSFPRPRCSSYHGREYTVEVTLRQKRMLDMATTLTLNMKNYYHWKPLYCKKLENSSWSCGNFTEAIGNREPIRNCWKHMMIHQFFLDSIRSTYKAWVPPSPGNSILGGLKGWCAVVCCSLIVHYTRYEIQKCEMLYNHVSHHFVIFFHYMVVSIQNILESRISGWCFMFVYESAKNVNFKKCGRLT